MGTTGWIITGGLAFWLLTCAALVDIARKDFGGIEKKSRLGLRQPGALHRRAGLFHLRLSPRAPQDRTAPGHPRQLIHTPIRPQSEPRRQNRLTNHHRFYIPLTTKRVVPSSRGLGRRPLTPVTRVRIPLGSPTYKIKGLDSILEPFLFSM